MLICILCVLTYRNNSVLTIFKIPDEAAVWVQKMFLSTFASFTKRKIWALFSYASVSLLKSLMIQFLLFESKVIFRIAFLLLNLALLSRKSLRRKTLQLDPSRFLTWDFLLFFFFSLQVLIGSSVYFLYCDGRWDCSGLSFCYGNIHWFSRVCYSEHIYS